jgi:L-fuculose-phosphate aldolase
MVREEGSMSDRERIKKELSHYGRLLVERELVVGPGGNISARVGDVVYLSPSGLALDEIDEGGWIGIELGSGEVIDGPKGLRPTSETTMHLGCYMARDDIRAVIHTHPAIATALATTGISKFEGMVPDFIAYLGKYIPVLHFIIPCGEEIRTAVTEELVKGHNAVLLSNHGLVTVGSNLKEAYYRTELVENSAKFLLACKLFGIPRYLTEEEKEAISNLEAEDYRRALLKGAGAFKLF